MSRENKRHVSPTDLKIALRKSRRVEDIVRRHMEQSTCAGSEKRRIYVVRTLAPVTHAVNAIRALVAYEATP